MKAKKKFPILRSVLATALLALAAGGVLGQSHAAGGTVISNTAKYTYSDPAGNPHSNQSNTVTVTIAVVSGIVITPDGATAPSLVSNEKATLPFTMTNTGNTSMPFTFPVNGAGETTTGPVTILRAVIDLNNNGVIDPGEPDILLNAAAVNSAAVAQGSSIKVLVEVQAKAAATPGTYTAKLGDSASDDVVDDGSVGGVKTSDATAVNGVHEAVGSYTGAIVKDSQLQITAIVPAGPISPGSTIPYTVQSCNPADRPVTAMTLPGAPAGANSSVFIVAPIPQFTQLTAGQSFPVGTLYSTDLLTTAPTMATWATTQPVLASITRLAFPVGNSLAAGACSANIPFTVTVLPSAPAGNSIVFIADTFGTSSLGNPVTDQTGDATPNKGNGNGSSVPLGGTAGTGVPQITAVVITAGVLNGTSGHADATGPTGTNDDYTNKSSTTGLSGVAPGANTTASATVIFTNTLQNSGNGNDKFVLTTPTVPPGFTVEISLDSGTTWTTVSGGSSVTTATLAPAAAMNYQVRVTAPAGIPAVAGYDTVIKATSVTDPTVSNNTIDRLYTGYLKLAKTAVVANTTGLGGPTDAVPGAQITYQITYTNIAVSGGTNSVTLTVTNTVITENGNAAPNNWGNTTDHVAASATDTNGGTITGDTTGSSVLTDTVPTLAPGQSGTFAFKRKIKQ